ncbi:hypothetical protein MUU72_14540 [Streptomyces sp. RS10V-4]|uniref:hypothetical protein n=1 Tax=Streptomyces rhizoryzae TaxID=2932493 RepID=UPI002003CD4E|nr:hypothetical protein [Streptomyces rhizoryzae]MCK7624305.1 hypothetical protein [Streptomyces rhizoryzae]
MTTEEFDAAGRPANEAPAAAHHSPDGRPGSGARSGLPAGRWAIGVAGLAVGAGLVGAAWWGFSGGGSESGGAGLGRSAGDLSLPASLGKYVPFKDAAQRNGGNASQAIQRTTKTEEQTTKLLSTAYGGAPAAVRTLAEPGLETFFMVNAVRARTPEPFTPYEDVTTLGLVRPMREVVRVGGATCLVANQPTPTGQQPRPDAVSVDYCQRTADGLTVQIRGISGGLRNSPQQVAELLDEAWSALS